LQASQFAVAQCQPEAPNSNPLARRTAGKLEITELISSAPGISVREGEPANP